MIKRKLLPAAAAAVLLLSLAGCTVTGGVDGDMDIPKVTSNVTSSPEPVKPTEAPDDERVTPSGSPGAGSRPDEAGGLTSGTGINNGPDNGDIPDTAANSDKY